MQLHEVVAQSYSRDSACVVGDLRDNKHDGVDGISMKVTLN